MHYYRFNLKDWAQSTAHLSLVEDAIYRRLIDWYYETEKPIPLETQTVIRRLRLVGHEQELAIVLTEFFTKTDQGYTHPRCDLEIAAYHAKADKNRANGRSGGRPKKSENNPDGFQEKPTGNLNHKPPNHKPLTNKNTMANPDGFDAFWSAYPRKVSKPQAIRAFAKIKPDDQLLEAILAALTNQKRSDQWTRDGGAFIPHPATWLNNQRWTDEVRHAQGQRPAEKLSPIDQVRRAQGKPTLAEQRAQQAQSGPAMGAHDWDVLEVVARQVGDGG